MSFIKRLIEDFTAPLEGSMTKKPGQVGPFLRYLRQYQREFVAGQAQKAGYTGEAPAPVETLKALAGKKGDQEKRKGSSRGRREGERSHTQSTSTQSTSTPSTSTPSTSTRPARPSRTRPARPARTRKKPSENDDDK